MGDIKHSLNIPACKSTYDQSGIYSKNYNICISSGYAIIEYYPKHHPWIGTFGRKWECWWSQWCWNICSPHSGSNQFCNCKENTLCVRRKEKLESWSAHLTMNGSSRKTDLGLELVLKTVVDIQTEQKRCWHDAGGELITGFLTWGSFHCCPSHATPRPRPTTWECLGGALFIR